MAEIQDTAMTSGVVEAVEALISLKEPTGFDLNVRPASKDVSMVNSYLGI